MDGMEQGQHQVHFVLVEEGQGVVADVQVLHVDVAVVAYALVGWLALVVLKQSRRSAQDRFVQLDVPCIEDQTIHLVRLP